MPTLALLLSAVAVAGPPQRLESYDGPWQHMRVIQPQQYVAYRTSEPVVIDGRGDDAAWQSAEWTAPFVDIEGDRKPRPQFLTRAKMTWDDDYFYVFARLDEPHVWATLTEKNSVMFQDNDFEVFIDPDGDNHDYYEFEMNALNTIWELSLGRPYMDGGPLRNPHNIDGVRTAVHIDGTLNDAGDEDSGWSVEIAFPWEGLARHRGAAHTPPRDGDQWRVGFSRVEWMVNIVDGKYVKVPRTERPEDNWVWSPQGLINMHRPERWGFVQFSTAAPGTAEFVDDPTLPARDWLMGIYHRQRAYREQFGHYADSLDLLGMNAEDRPEIVTDATIEMTEASADTPADKTNGKDADKAVQRGYLVTVQLQFPDGTTRPLRLQHDSRLW
ncbi:MAG: carbohydrate-binding family 9-like protein [Pirellulales bacterium]